MDPQLGHLLSLDWKGWRDGSFSAGELLESAGPALEAWFRGPLLGPIPVTLVAHDSFYGCVAEYEEKLEELDRWKEERLVVWLKERIGKRCEAGGTVFVLQAVEPRGCEPPRFRFVCVEEPAECDNFDHT